MMDPTRPNRPTLIPGGGDDGGKAGPLFERADQTATFKEKQNLAALKEYLSRLDTGPSAIPYLPYLVLRSQVGDHGERPPAAPLTTTHSPDIWVVAGAPSSTPAIPPGPGTGLASLASIAGQQATVYAHVWNLGKAPAIGVRVDWYWIATPPCGEAMDNPSVNAIGFEMVDLGPRSSMDCHRLVKCPTAWPSVPSGATTVFAQATVLGDPLLTPWKPDADRHVARKDFDAGMEEVLDQVFDPRTVDSNTYAPTGESLCTEPFARPVQTFTAGVTGDLTRVEVFLGDGFGRNINVHVYETVAGVPSTTPSASGVIPSAQVPGATPAFVGVSLSGLQVTSGQQYAIGLTAAPPDFLCWAAKTWKGAKSNPYAGGVLYLDGELDPDASDLGFKTFVCRPAGGAPASGPAPEGQIRKDQHKGRGPHTDHHHTSGKQR